MADGGVRRRAPYFTVQALLAWAAHRRGYLRGRLLLAGIDIDVLDFGELVDVAEAVMFEPGVHAGASIDQMLDTWDSRMREHFASELDPDEVFATPEWQSRGDAMETLFPAAVVPDMPQDAGDGGDPA